MIYLDNNATTPLDQRVWEAMAADRGPLNPSSIHAAGREARNMLTRARRTIAERMGVRSKEILFTSGGTEAISLLLRGHLTGGHVITSGVEHAAVVTALADLPVEVEELPVGEWGAVTPDQLAAAIRPGTAAVVLMAANNETGVLTDLEGIAAVCPVPLIVDGVALLGKERFTIPDGVSAMVFSGHKFHGPKGAGFAVVRPSFQFEPQITGGGQEYGRRGGTENLGGILGLAKAVELAGEVDFEAMRALRDRLERGILDACPTAVVNGTGPRLSNTSNISFVGMDGDALLMNLDLAGLAVSHGSACSSGALEPSRVLLGMGYDRERAGSAIRFSLSRDTTVEEIDRAVDIVLEKTQLVDDLDGDERPAAPAHGANPVGLQ
jgi:cysteine desulfurase